MSKTKEERKQYQSNWYQTNKKKVNVYYSIYRDKMKQEMVAAYGGKCLHCEETDYVVLTIDHIDNDGNLDKKQGLEGGHKLYQRLKRLNWPTDRYQLLCFNCNFKKEYIRRKHAVILRETEEIYAGRSS